MEYICDIQPQTLRTIGNKALTMLESDRRMRGLVVICALGLFGCNTPSMHFSGIDPVRVRVLESTFDLRRRDAQVQVIRMSREYAPRLSQQLGRRAEIAVERQYGCPVSRIRGDASMMVAYLKCGKPDDLARIGNGP